MNRAAIRANQRKLIILAVVVLLCAAGYMFYAVNFGSARLFRYSMKLRSPKLIVMLITAFAIAGASMVFQTIINNVIVTPCLLGMNALYSLIHTAVVFVAGSASLLATNSNLAFAVDLALMPIVATAIPTASISFVALPSCDAGWISRVRLPPLNSPAFSAI